MISNWRYVQDVSPYAFGPAYSSEAKEMKEAALQYLSWYLESCYKAPLRVPIPSEEK